MKTTICMIIIGLLLLLPAGVCFSEQGAQPQAKGLDEQVQEIKSDVLAIAAELDQLEEKLLFPSQTQCSIFVSLAPAEAFGWMPLISAWTLGQWLPISTPSRNLRLCRRAGTADSRISPEHQQRGPTVCRFCSVVRTSPAVNWSAAGFYNQQGGRPGFL